MLIETRSVTSKVLQAHASQWRVSERGVALVVVMLFLIAITGIGLWTARQSILAEGMARNQTDQAVAWQAAEAALRDAERDFMTAYSAAASNASCSRGKVALNPNDFSQECKKGLCTFPDASYATASWTAASGTTSEPWWPGGKSGLWNDKASTKPGRTPVDTNNCDSFTGGVPLGTYTGTAAITGVARQPEYMIEYFRRKNVRMNLVETQVSGQGSNPNEWGAMYRITARGFGYSERTQVVLQTIFMP
ncbi:pilus assembly protein PilX [Diaphorobacter sp. HDW4B]|uniref:pilus assembly PilX family protein n=1 Tax=Diaphorobacter sp. HDW4B TaxID=2714925 RepID=UPI00140CDA4E|nr:PilX N-terminal domain-containing pilus assembly protein [Diaphorobacter sp. HDW4B]QIL72039.1 pilus assembly protein PilX [Diaphorobacter sp. HDW4B]